MTDLRVAGDRFHARFSAKEKVYRYTIQNSANRDVFARKYSYHLPEELNLSAMEETAALLVGTHDFKGFSTGRTKKSTVRHLSEIEIRPEGEKLLITTGFFSSTPARFTRISAIPDHILSCKYRAVLADVSHDFLAVFPDLHCTHQTRADAAAHPFLHGDVAGNTCPLRRLIGGFQHNLRAAGHHGGILFLFQHGGNALRHKALCTKAAVVGHHHCLPADRSELLQQHRLVRQWKPSTASAR